MDTLHSPTIQCTHESQRIQEDDISTWRRAILKSSRRRLDWRFLLRVAAAATIALAAATIALAAATIALAAAVTSVYFAIDKLGEIDDKVLVLARSEREVEKGLGFDRFHAQLHKHEAVNT